MICSTISKHELKCMQIHSLYQPSNHLPGLHVSNNATKAQKLAKPEMKHKYSASCT